MDYWREYLKFLIEWAESHESYEFVGMCPPSFDEWLDTGG